MESNVINKKEVTLKDKYYFLDLKYDIKNLYNKEEDEIQYLNRKIEKLSLRVEKLNSRVERLNNKLSILRNEISVRVENLQRKIKKHQVRFVLFFIVLIATVLFAIFSS